MFESIEIDFLVNFNDRTFLSICTGRMDFLWNQDDVVHNFPSFHVTSLIILYNFRQELLQPISNYFVNTL
jgi:hypothetical protein